MDTTTMATASARERLLESTRPSRDWEDDANWRNGALLALEAAAEIATLRAGEVIAAAIHDLAEEIRNAR